MSACVPEFAWPGGVVGPFTESLARGHATFLQVVSRSCRSLSCMSFSFLQVTFLHVTFRVTFLYVTFLQVVSGRARPLWLSSREERKGLLPLRPRRCRSVEG